MRNNYHVRQDRLAELIALNIITQHSLIDYSIPCKQCGEARHYCGDRAGTNIIVNIEHLCRKCSKTGVLNPRGRYRNKNNPTETIAGHIQDAVVETMTDSRRPTITDGERPYVPIPFKQYIK